MRSLAEADTSATPFHGRSAVDIMTHRFDRQPTLARKPHDPGLRHSAGMELADIGPLTVDQRLQLEGDEPDPFDVARLGPIDSRRKEQHVVLRADGRLVASVGMLVAAVEVARGERFEVVGVGGVIVVAEHRGRGLARVVLDAALERAATLGPDFALLFCHERVSGLYAKLGFRMLPPPVLVQQLDSVIAMPQPAMWRALREGAQWPPGDVFVRSLPF
jgi:GNAT superfamily N-acetyltransferase